MGSDVLLRVRRHVHKRHGHLNTFSAIAAPRQRGPTERYGEKLVHSRVIVSSRLSNTLAMAV